MNRVIEESIKALNNNDLSCVNDELINCMNNIAMAFIHGNEIELEDVYGTLMISNVLYNNTTASMLPLEDGVYDLVVTKYNNVTGGNSPVGAKPIVFDPVNDTVVTKGTAKTSDGLIKVVSRVEDADKLIFFDNFIRNSVPMKAFYDHTAPENFMQMKTSATDVEHAYPELVGTLDKCKFVLNAEARSRGINDDNTVWTFENNFMHIITSRGINFNQLIAELKYDGVSVEATVVGDTIVSATSRGDTLNNEARDLTPIFGGYVFPKAEKMHNETTRFGIKFECIVTFDNMVALQRDFGMSFVNGRVAVIAIMKMKNARKYLPYLTLVPIRTGGLNILDRQVEVEFLNSYYSSGVDLKYAIMNGDYNQLLFMVKQFTQEAEYVRPTMPFMYDGVVVSLTDPRLKEYLGRTNSVDKWSIAIKFNAEVKQTIFLGYSFTVGQNGMVTPMAKIRPIEFLGAVQSEISMHSYKRFMDIGLKVGDIINVEFRHDVMAYITKPDNMYNKSNPNPVIPFPDVCPFCGTKLQFSNKSAMCPNMNCPERQTNMAVNMMDKLNIKDFGRALISKLGIYSFTDFVTYDPDKAISILGDAIGAKFNERVLQFNNTKMYDYRVIGAIGFDSVGQAKWKLILANARIEDVISLSDNELESVLKSIKGIGPVVAKTIVAERDLRGRDLVTIANMPNVVRSFGEIDQRIQVRFTGVRDEALEQAFIAKGLDADGKKSVSKKTGILIVPHVGFTSSKTKSVNPRCLILDVESAWNYVRSI